MAETIATADTDHLLNDESARNQNRSEEVFDHVTEEEEE